MGRIAVVCPKSSDRFVGPVETILRMEHEVRRFDADEALQADEWGDAVFCEWAAKHAAVLAAFGKKPLVVRLHRYEVDGDWFPGMRFDRMTLLPTSAHILERARERAVIERAAVIPSIVDFDRFKFTGDRNGYWIGVVADIHHRKQPGLWLQILKELPWHFTLHHVGAIRDAGLWRYLRSTAAALGLENRIRWDGEIPHDQMPEWWARKKFCLSAAMDEGCPYNVIEAAACGAIPVVHRYEGADESLGPAVPYWASTKEADHALRGFVRTDTEKMRSDFRNRFSVQANAEALLSLFRS